MKANRFAPLRAIGRVTFFELIRDRVLYNAVLLAAVLLVSGYLAARLSFVRPDRVILDLGLAAIALSCGLIAALMGAQLIPREFERRTVFVALARPISRGEFLVGKYLGLVTLISINWFLLSTALVFVLMLASDSPAFALTQTLGPTGFQALLLLLFQSLLLAAFAVFFSTFTTASLSIALTFGLYLAGINVSHFKMLAADPESAAIRPVLEFLVRVLPNFESFNLGFKITYGIPVSAVTVLWAILYAVIACALWLWFASFLIRRKDA